MFPFKVLRYAVAACVTTTIAICFAAVAHSQTIDTSQVLIGSTRCDHVIAQVMRHGVNRSVDQPAMHPMVGSTPFGLASIPSGDIGDLQIVSVHRRPEIVEGCGPCFTVVVMNQSQHKVDGVDVSLVGLLGAIHPHAPNATVRTCEIAPGTAAEVEVTLPIGALAMGNNNGKIIGFQKLIVAIDSHDEWIEMNEANNVQALATSSIPMLADAVDQVGISSLPTEIVTSESASAMVTQVDVPKQIAPEATDASEASEAPGSTDLDELRRAVEKLGANVTEVARTSP
ncbi:hypothetical protein Pla22_14730 [Rubripirellula amarantea]|uniref:CARDB domain-containing protein n=1 Tax=Rubripirellula amarantea TaxID=2527999 RepID=A0A5C5WUD2_9BACT|nr:hypothetical protein [Rubripirellula amarantea]TWT53839.1 hypothetical protein Pla22_14730 [Rubripirellula amarantea]